MGAKSVQLDLSQNRWVQLHPLHHCNISPANRYIVLIYKKRKSHNCFSVKKNPVCIRMNLKNMVQIYTSCMYAIPMKIGRKLLAFDHYYFQSQSDDETHDAFQLHFRFRKKL